MTMKIASLIIVVVLAATPSPAMQGRSFRVQSEKKISETSGGLIGPLYDNTRFGDSVASIGDLDGDGIVDLAVGGAFDSDGGWRRGAVWILFLNADGTVARQSKISSTQGGFSGALDDADAFGWSVTCLGDLDGDCIPDLAVGACGDDDGGLFSFHDLGAVWILFLNQDGTVRSEQKISATQGDFTGSLDLGDCFGTSLALLGDLDRDGTLELAVGAQADDDGGEDRGAVWILSLLPDGAVQQHRKISATSGGLNEPLPSFGYFGVSATALADMDGDGGSELVVGSLYGENTDYVGSAYVCFLNPDCTVKSSVRIGANSGGFSGTLEPEDFFFLARSIGDLDGDGVPDLAVGAVGDDDGGPDRGAVWVLFLNPDGTVDDSLKFSDLSGGLSAELDDGDFFGVSIAPLGDIDGDGELELAIGAANDDDDGPDTGAVWILSLGEARARRSAAMPGTGSVTLPLRGNCTRRQAGVVAWPLQPVPVGAIPVLWVKASRPFPGRMDSGGVRPFVQVGSPSFGGLARFTLPSAFAGIPLDCSAAFYSAASHRWIPARVALSDPLSGTGLDR